MKEKKTPHKQPEKAIVILAICHASASERVPDPLWYYSIFFFFHFSFNELSTFRTETTMGWHHRSRCLGDQHAHGQHASFIDQHPRELTDVVHLAAVFWRECVQEETGRGSRS